MVIRSIYLSFILLLTCFISIIELAWSQGNSNDFYQIKKVSIPENVVLEVGGLAFDDKGNLGVTTRRGELWLIENPNSTNPNYLRFAHGMHEPLGLAFKDGSFYCAQRGELTQLTDKNGDNKADVYKTIYRWDLEGNYHEYSYGPIFTPEGDMLVTLNLGWIGYGASLSKWRGWLVKITPDGQLEPIATGMRSPAGFGYNNNGDIFYTENQGDWVGSGRMTHVEKGDFVGNPAGLKWTDEANSPLKLNPEDIDDTKGWTLYQYGEEVDAVKAPSVWFPHTLMGISTSDIEVIPANYGPFEGQLLVGDQGHSKIMRVFQEKINGVYQGICFPFIEGFSSGILRLEWAPDQKDLFVGMTSRGWASTGPEMYALERLVWTGKTPFEMETVNIEPDGFTITFTQPINPDMAQNINNYSITDFTYQYHRIYGSPVTDKATRKIQSITVSEDNRSVRLKLDQLRIGYIYEIKLGALKSASGQGLWHQVGYYTLNQIPGGGKTKTTNENIASSDNHSASNSLKRVNEMPSDWANGPEKTLELGTKPGLMFDQNYLMVKAGQKVKLTFNNPDDMQHNFVIVNPGKADNVGEGAMKLGLDGETMGYIPASENVLFHTGLLQPGTSETIYFVAPTKPGNYQYVCTFPGHHVVMRGILQVK